MNTLKQLLFAVAVMICFSMTAAAQKGNPPPKETPPIIPVQPEKNKPKDDKPKDDNKKPSSFIVYLRKN